MKLCPDPRLQAKLCMFVCVHFPRKRVYSFPKILNRACDLTIYKHCSKTNYLTSLPFPRNGCLIMRLLMTLDLSCNILKTNFV